MKISSDGTLISKSNLIKMENAREMKCTKTLSRFLFDALANGWSLPVRMFSSVFFLILFPLPWELTWFTGTNLATKNIIPTRPTKPWNLTFLATVFWLHLDCLHWSSFCSLFSFKLVCRMQIWVKWMKVTTNQMLPTYKMIDKILKVLSRN